MTARNRPRLRLAVGAAVSCLTLLAVAGCSEDSGESSGPAASGESTPQEQAPIEITLEGDTVSPMGERIEVALGEPVRLVVTADREGSLHVHSTPEQEVDFTEGTSEHEIVLDQPGIVEVESHDPDLVVLQLEVR